MSLIVVGLNHRTAPVGLLERMTVPEEQLAKVLHDLSAREHLLEVVVLSTCNRIEVYARCTHFHPAVGDVSAFLSAYSGAAPEDFADLLYTYYDDAAVAHLFSVAAGLDSMIVGEGEILGQVRHAWQTAVREGTAPQLAGLVPAHGRVGQAGAHRDGYQPPSGFDPFGRGHRRGRAPRNVRRREGARGRRRPDGYRPRVDAPVARRRTRVDRQPHIRPRAGGRGRVSVARRFRSTRSPTRSWMPTCCLSSTASLAGSHRALDHRDGDGVPGWASAARRRRRPPA